MRPQLDNAWIMDRAKAQGGRITHRQLRDGGLPSSTIRRHVRSHYLAAEARGVYRVGPDVPTRTGPLWRALLACGEGAALSHPNAGVEHLLVRAWAGDVHVSVPTTSGRLPPRGVVLHRRRDLVAVEVDGLPCTAIALTLVDLAHRFPRLLGRALNEAQRLMLDVGDLRGVAAGRPGGRRLLAALEAYDGREARTREELERRALRMLVERRAPVYEPNARVTAGGIDWEVDGLYREERLVVELQSEAHHATPEARRQDRVKANALAQAGFALVQWDWRDVTRDADATVRGLLASLAQRRTSSTWAAPPSRRT